MNLPQHEMLINMFHNPKLNHLINRKTIEG